MVKNMVKGLDEWTLADGSMKDRTTRGNRALWYHSNALGEAFIILEIAKIANVKIPNSLETKLLKAAELFNDAYLDHSVIEPWAKKRHNSQASNGRQEFNSNLDSIFSILGIKGPKSYRASGSFDIDMAAMLRP